jgi:excisionase family DNA binding protein
MSDVHDLIGPSEAGRILGVSERTITRWARSGHLPVATKRPSGQRRFERSAVLALLDQQFVEGGAA